jgi:hypothetical protein
MRRILLVGLGLTAVVVGPGCGQGGQSASTSSTGPAPGCSSEACERERAATQKACAETPREEEARCLATGGSRKECDANRVAREVEDGEGRPC